MQLKNRTTGSLIHRAGRALALPAAALLAALMIWTAALAEGTITVCVLDSGCNVADVEGESFLSGDEALTDSIGHGTNICALVQGMAPEARVVMLKCFDDMNNDEEEPIAKALRAAVDVYHADVINMSWTSTAESDGLREAIAYAREQGAVLVASAGNLSLASGLGSVIYPAAYDAVIGVAGVDLTKEGQPSTSLWYLYGQQVDVCARGDCGDEKGSSYAAARISGLIAAALQDGMEPAQIDEYLAGMASDMGTPGRDDRFGWGYVETD